MKPWYFSLSILIGTGASGQNIIPTLVACGRISTFVFKQKVLFPRRTRIEKYFSVHLLRIDLSTLYRVLRTGLIHTVVSNDYHDIM